MKTNVFVYDFICFNLAISFNNKRQQFLKSLMGCNPTFLYRDCSLFCYCSLFNNKKTTPQPKYQNNNIKKNLYIIIKRKLLNIWSEDTQKKIEEKIYVFIKT